MAISANKKSWFIAIILFLIAINIIIQSFVSEDDSTHNSEEEKMLGKIREVRMELQRLEAAEVLLRTNSGNFAHPAVLKALHISEGETGGVLLVPETEASSTAPAPKASTPHPPSAPTPTPPLQHPPLSPEEATITPIIAPPASLGEHCPHILSFHFS